MMARRTGFMQLAILGLTWVISAEAQAKVETFNIDSKDSKLTWKGSKVVGDSHTGTIAIERGQVSFKDGVPVKAEIVVDMTSIKDTDLTDAKWNKKLVDHLKSDDFFGVSKHATAKLVVDKFVAKSKGTYELSGTLTIKGHSQPITLTAHDSGHGTERRITADLAFDRTLFDVRYGSGKFFDNLGDKLISDQIELHSTIRLDAKPVNTAAK